jgi:flagellar hook-associated protein 3 FlgL
MRITNNMILRNSLAGIQSNSSAVQKVQGQISSGLKLSTSSDDPTGVSQVMVSSSSLRAIDQYKRNIDNASSRSDAEGAALDRLNDLLTRAKELAVSAATDTATPEGRKIASKEMEQIFQSAVSIGNTKFGDEYLFGGDNATTKPFTTSGTGATLAFADSAPSGTRSVEVSAGQTVVSAHDGQQAFLDSGVLQALKDLTVGLASGNRDGVTAAMPAIDRAFMSTQQLIGESGARSNSLQVAAQNLTALKLNLTTYRSSLQDVDIEEAVTTLVTKQTAYQAAMMATSKVLGMTLTDYLR